MAKKHSDGHSGSSWKVAYADFTTAMMALFLCLWLTSQDQKIKDAVERAFRNPFSTITKESVGIIPNRDVSATFKQQGKFSSVSAVEMETMHRLSEDLEKLLQQEDRDRPGVEIKLTPDGLNINVFDRAQKPIFQPNSDTFTDYGSWVFSTLAWEIARYTTFHIELEGHTETKLKGTDREAVNKWDLSTERANSARRKLVQSGVRSEQICKVSGYADTEPMPGCDPAAEINRRVTVLVKLNDSMKALDNNPNPSVTTTLP